MYIRMLFQRDERIFGNATRNVAKIQEYFSIVSRGKEERKEGQKKRGERLAKEKEAREIAQNEKLCKISKM